MPIAYEEIVPWGRSKAEYIRMFGLTKADLGKTILDCGGGPASFNAEMTKAGHNVVSADPIYDFTPPQISRRIEETFDLVLTQTHENMDKFTWRDIPDLETLAAIRRIAMDEFLADFEPGTAEGRYQVGELPALGMENLSFDIALSSHFLFLYSDNLATRFHIEAVLEMMRVAGEARIFPLVDMNAQTSPHLAPVIEALKAAGLESEVRDVDYEFQKGANRMLLVRHRDFTDGV